MIVALVMISAALQQGSAPKTAITVSDQKSNAAPQKKRSPETSMTGCIDQQAGQYVLVDDHGLKRIADLEAEGFPTEGFAKHLGHKVVVRGTSSAGEKQPLMKVRTIETVSETCAPQKN
jgi:hypothetical protein